MARHEDLGLNCASDGRRRRMLRPVHAPMCPPPPRRTNGPGTSGSGGCVDKLASCPTLRVASVAVTHDPSGPYIGRRAPLPRDLLLV